RAGLVDDDLGRLRLRVVTADRLDHAAVTRRALIGDDYAPDRILLAPHAGESYSYGHKRPASLACVLQMNHAVLEAALVDEPQIQAQVLGQRALAAAHDHRGHVEVDLVHDPCGKRRSCEPGA